MNTEMKDSGIDGIGLIPISWHTKNLGVFFTENIRVNYAFTSSNALQFKYGEIIQKANNNRELEEQEVELLKRYILVEPNDIVVNGLNLNYDFNSLRIARVKESGIITSAYIILRPKFEGDTSYFNYLLKTLDHQKIFHGMGVGIRLTLKFKELRSMLIPIPPQFEQTAIAQHLDKKCAEIDELISLQEQMIAQLTTYKQAVITETVTRGLNPNVKMKPSGVEWIGEIPEHWEVAKLKNLLTLKTGTTPKAFEDIKESDELINWYTPSDILENGNVILTSERKLAKRILDTEKITLYPSGSLMFVGIGALAGKVGYAIEAGYSNQQITALIPKCCNGKFYYYFLIADKNRIRDNAFFTTLPIINNGYLGQVFVLFPPIEEQTAIAHYLDQKCQDIDALISLKQEKIEQLKAYKKSVIFEYVTGKKRV